MQQNERSLTLIERVAEKTGKSIYNCYQCQKCSSGCPVSEFMDYLPAEIIRMVQLGFEDRVLSSKSIWVCASCETCTTRCPNEIDIAMTMDVLREMSASRGLPAGENNVLNLHRSFLSTIRRFGKLHELGLILSYKLKSKKYLDDLKLGFNMFRKGKITILPAVVKGKRDIKKILAKY